MEWGAILRYVAPVLASAVVGAVGGVQGWVAQQGGVVSKPKMEEGTANVVSVLGAEIARLQDELEACREGSG